MPAGSNFDEAAYARPPGDPGSSGDAPPGAPSVDGDEQPNKYHATLVCAIEIELAAETTEQANELIHARARQLIEKLQKIVGFNVRAVALLDPQTGLAAEAFIDQVQGQ